MNHSNFIATCEDAWKIIQARNEDVPDAVIVVAGGGRSAHNVLGHFAKDAWENDKGDPIHEVLLVAEHLKRPAEELFTTLLHESVHGIALKRGIKDVSGKRHNKKFANLCYEVGLIPPSDPHPTLGWSAATLSDTAEDAYRSIIDSIGLQLQYYRKLRLKETETKKTTWIGVCQCERKIRLPKKTIQNASIDDVKIVCSMCGTAFEVEDQDGFTED
jgi:hypothetical protein